MIEFYRTNTRFKKPNATDVIEYLLKIRAPSYNTENKDTFLFNFNILLIIYKVKLQIEVMIVTIVLQIKYMHMHTIAILDCIFQQLT